MKRKKENTCDQRIKNRRKRFKEPEIQRQKVRGNSTRQVGL